MEGQFFEFREVRTADELRRTFELRYKLYRDSRLKDFCEENEFGVDLDYYEFFGRHMGLFKIEHGSSTLIGFHRPIFPKLGVLQREILKVASEYPGLAEVVLAKPSQPLPMMAYWPDPKPLRRFYDEATSQGALVAEATKFAVEPADSSLALARHVIDAEHAIQFFCNGADYSIMGIASSHFAMYRRYGYELIPGTDECELRGVKTLSVFLSRKSIPQQIRQRLMQMAVAYMETGAVWFNPTAPSQYYAPEGPAEAKLPVVSMVA